MPWLLLASLADAGERLLARGDLVLRRASLAVEITRIEIPAPPAVPLEDPADRSCRATASWDPAARRVVFAPVGCHPELAPLVAEAVSHWSLQLRPPPTAQQDIVVAWFLFPELPDRPVQLALSVVPGTEVISLPDGIALAQMARPTKRAPVMSGIRTDEACSAVVKVDESGTPYNFAIEGCSPAAQAAARSGLLDWKFSPASFGNAAVRVRVPVTVRFGADGTVGIRVAAAADDDMRYLAEDPSAAREQAEEILPPVPPLPEGPPLLVVHHSYYAPVEIYTLDLPPPAAAPARCTVGVQVRSDRRSYAWTEEPCDPAVRDSALAAANAWLLRPGDVRAEGEVFARFRADLWWREAGQPPVLVFDEREVTAPNGLPPSIVTYIGPEAIRQVPPKEVEGRKGTCVLAVAIDDGGRPADVTPETCPDELVEPATSAVRKWRWNPARMGGEKVEAHTRVSVRFR
jgi:hypothetical protein